MLTLCLVKGKNFIVIASLSSGLSLLFVCMPLRVLGMLCFIVHNGRFALARGLSRGLGEYPAFLVPLEHRATFLGGQVNLITGCVSQVLQVQIRALAKWFPH